MRKSMLVVLIMLAGCQDMLPMEAPPGTSIVRLSKVTANISPSPMGGGRADACQFVKINVPEGDPACIHMEHEGCVFDTCKEPSE